MTTFGGFAVIRSRVKNLFKTFVGIVYSIGGRCVFIAAETLFMVKGLLLLGHGYYSAVWWSFVNKISHIPVRNYPGTKESCLK